MVMVMSMVAKREITNVVRVRYALADRTQKGIILDEFVSSFGFWILPQICNLFARQAVASDSSRFFRRSLAVWNTSTICIFRIRTANF